MIERQCTPRQAVFCFAAVLAATVALQFPSRTQAVLYWDADQTAAGNNTATGAGLGGAGAWGSANNWFNGASDVPWTAGSDAVFTGTAGTVTLGAPQSPASLAFKSNGYSLTGSTLTMGSLATFQVDAGVTATIASVIAGSATMTKTGPGTLYLSNASNINTANTTAGGWRIDGGILRIAGDGSLGAPLPDSARNTVTDIQLNQSTIQFAAPTQIDVNRRTKVNTNGAVNLGDAVIDTNGHSVSWFGSIQGGVGSLTVTNTGPNPGILTLGTDDLASVNPWGSALPGGTVNLTVRDGAIVQTSGQVTPTGGELGSETGAGGAVLAIKLDNGQIRSESGGYSFQRNLILGPGGGSLDTGAWQQVFTGTVSGPGGLSKWGSGTLVIDNTPSDPWTGGTTVNQGILQLGRAGSNGLLPGTLGSPSQVEVKPGATLKFHRGSNKSFFDNISGGGNVEIENVNNAVVRLVSDNTYTGLTTITSGRLMIGQGNPGQPGSLASNVLNNSELIFNRVEDLTYAGSIAGSGILTKQAAGKLTLTGSSSYSGATNVTAGTLIAANSTGSATGTGPVNVASGATLAGTGSIAGPVTVNAGGSLAPGNSPGKLTFTNPASNALTWVMPNDPADSAFRFEINDANGAAGMNPGWDALVVSQGGVVLQAAPGAGMTIELTSLIGDNTPGALINFNPYEEYVWPFIDTALGFSGVAIEDINFVVDDAQFAAANGMATGRFSVIQDTPLSLALQFDPFDPGDFNLDGSVDGEDLVEWKSSFGPGNGADADDDGDSDGDDFLAWQRQLGSGLPATAAAAAVPEPAPLALISLAGCGLALVLQQRR